MGRRCSPAWLRQASRSTQPAHHHRNHETRDLSVSHRNVGTDVGYDISMRKQLVDFGGGSVGDSSLHLWTSLGPHRLPADSVSTGFGPTLRTEPRAGRGLAAPDDRLV